MIEKYKQYSSVYSFSDYILTVRIPQIGNLPAETISIGGPGEGEGTCVGTITIQRNTPLWTTDADPSGSWVHSKNLDRHGTVTVNIRQVSNYVVKLIMIFNAYYSSVGSKRTNNQGLTLTLTQATSDTTTNTIAQCEDCLITNIPNQSFSASAENQTWTFTCGAINFTPTL